MLKGIPEVIGSDLLKALADTGHGDLVVIADHFYPPVSKSPNAYNIQAKGVSAPAMLDAILKLFPLDVEYEKYPVQYMVPDPDSGVDLKDLPVWNEMKKVVEDNGYSVDCVGEIGRTAFYEKAGKAFITISTSEQRPYGCVMIQKGVL